MAARSIATLCALALVSSGCMGAGSNAKSAPSSQVKSDIARGIGLAGKNWPVWTITSTATVTPADPREGTTSLFAVKPDKWDAAANPDGSIQVPGGPPFQNGYAGLSFEATAGVTYLTVCRTEQASPVWTFYYEGSASGGGAADGASAEFAMASARTATDGRASLRFAVEQAGHALHGCTVYGLKLG